MSRTDEDTYIVQECDATDDAIKTEVGIIT